jgi:hypothetical protein
MSEDATELKLKPFSADEWVPAFREYIAKELKFLPPDWLAQKLIKIDPPKESDLVDECKKVRDAKNRRPHLLQAITGQAEGLHRGLKLLLGSNRPVELDTPMTARLMNAANDELLPVLFYFKTEFNAARPAAYIKDLNPMFAKPHPNYPGHPTYPSGHAAQSWMFALLFGAMFPHLDSALKDLAKDIAQNRVVAGVHFEADSKAWQELAEQLFKLLKADPRFFSLVQLARAEWPEAKLEEARLKAEEAGKSQ